MRCTRKEYGCIRYSNAELVVLKCFREIRTTQRAVELTALLSQLQYLSTGLQSFLGAEEITKLFPGEIQSLPIRGDSAPTFPHTHYWHFANIIKF